MTTKQKYEWHFHNDQGAWLATVVSVSEAGARRIFRQSWGGPAKCRQGDAV
jgi:hypothetical protein